MLRVQRRYSGRNAGIGRATDAGHSDARHTGTTGSCEADPLSAATGRYSSACADSASTGTGCTGSCRLWVRAEVGFTRPLHAFSDDSAGTFASGSAADSNVGCNSTAPVACARCITASASADSAYLVAGDRDCHSCNSGQEL